MKRVNFDQTCFTRPDNNVVAQRKNVRFSIIVKITENCLAAKNAGGGCEAFKTNAGRQIYGDLVGA
ncbi:hypothetical protein NKH57_33310 [Mesorhizobium sp. M1050]